MRPDRLAQGRKRAERILSIWECDDWWRERIMGEWRDQILHTMIRTRKVCSCVMCGNPRRHFGERTRQEQLADLEMREQIVETLYIQPEQEIAWDDWWSEQHDYSEWSSMIEVANTFD